MKWTCEGSVRGCCGVKHKSHEAAEQHCAADNASATRGTSSGSLTRPYSDRMPVPVDAEAIAEAEAMREGGGL